MTISPAILVSDPEQLLYHLERYLAAGIRSIDIDIQETPFVSESTVAFAEAFAVVQTLDLPEDLSLGWDLKLADPHSAVAQIVETFPSSRVYIYQAIGDDLIDELIDLGVALALLDTDKLYDLEYYERFPEVQVMSVEAETQGAKISLESLAKVTELREMGYSGLISIDGGVHLETAELVKSHPIDRVSVGSYFQQSDNVKDAYREINGKLQ